MNLGDLAIHGILGGVGGAKIKNKQTGSIFVSSSAISVETTISPVDLDKSIVRIRYFRDNGGSNRSVKQALFLAKFKDSSTLEFSRGGSGGTNGDIFWEVIEFENVTVQRGITVARKGYTGTTVEVAPYNSLKSLIFYSNDYQLDNSISDLDAFKLLSDTVYIRDDTSISIRHGGGGLIDDGSNVSWQIVEFNN